MQEVIVIEPGRHERNYWVDLWRYRELFRVLAWRDLAVRYKQTVIGVAWAVQIVAFLRAGEFAHDAPLAPAILTFVPLATMAFGACSTAL